MVTNPDYWGSVTISARLHRWGRAGPAAVSRFAQFAHGGADHFVWRTTAGQPAHFYGWRQSAMIIVTRLNGPQVALNPDLIERAEATPDTVLTLVDGTKYIVLDSVEEIVAKVREFRASVVAVAHAMEVVSAEPPALRVLPNPEGRV